MTVSPVKQKQEIVPGSTHNNRNMWGTSRWGAEPVEQHLLRVRLLLFFILRCLCSSSFSVRNLINTSTRSLGSLTFYQEAAGKVPENVQRHWLRRFSQTEPPEHFRNTSGSSSCLKAASGIGHWQRRVSWASVELTSHESQIVLTWIKYNK